MLRHSLIEGRCASVNRKNSTAKPVAHDSGIPRFSRDKAVGPDGGLSPQVYAENGGQAARSPTCFSVGFDHVSTGFDRNLLSGVVVLC